MTAPAPGATPGDLMSPQMSAQMQLLIGYDLPVLLSGVFAAVACALLGNFLVLRRMSLMGDAISHAVLPGIVIAFIISSARTSWPMFLGAGASGVATVFLVEIVRRWGRVEVGAAMGVVFSALFALGILLLHGSHLEGVDLDADCVLYGQPEYIFWLPPATWSEFWQWGTFAPGPGGPPRQLITLAVVCALVALFVVALFKELRLATFDPALSTALGFNATALHFGLMAMVAGAVVAAFEAVGSILVIAMLICPPATARLLTDRLSRQLWLSALIAAATAALGYWFAADAERLFGAESSLSAAGMMAVTSGAALALAIVAAPRYGIIARTLRRSRVRADSPAG